MPLHIAWERRWSGLSWAEDASLFPAAAIRLLSLLLIVCALGCAPSDPTRVRLDPDVSGSALAFLFGSYASPDAADPFRAGLLVRDGGRVYADPTRLPGTLDADADGQATRDEIRDWVQATYAQARHLPATLGALDAERSYRDGFCTLGRGVMTQHARRVCVPEPALRHALQAFADSGRIAYPVGTLLVGEHWDTTSGDSVLVETTVKQRRADGFWDFAVYDAQGNLANRTQAAPRALNSPTQCVGCHLGQRAFEPEASFPAAAPDGAHGPQVLYVPDAWRDPELVARFDEHRRRDDHVLGLYATFYTAHLRSLRAAGQLDPEGLALLADLDL
jgi:hypothetical protein